VKIMTAQRYSSGVQSLRAADTFPTPFQQIFAAFCVLMTDSYIFLFFCNLASKFQQLLIIANAADINRIQREFLFNNCIASQNYFSSLSQCRKNPNFLKPLPFVEMLTRRAVTSRRRKAEMLIVPLPLKRGSAILLHGLNKSDEYHTSGLWRVLSRNPLDCCQRTKLVRDSNTLQFRSKTQCPHP
jgi:hypothetical protein